MKKIWGAVGNGLGGVGWGGGELEIHPGGSGYSEREWMVCHIVLRWAETQQFLVMANQLTFPLMSPPSPTATMAASSIQKKKKKKSIVWSNLIRCRNSTRRCRFGTVVVTDFNTENSLILRATSKSVFGLKISLGSKSPSLWIKRWAMQRRLKRWFTQN